jgi:hypothetical protein
VSAHPEAALLSDTEEQMVFRGDRRDAAFEHGATCAALLRDFVQKSRRKRIFANAVVGDQVEKHGDIVIGDPQVFTYDDDGAALKAAVNRTFERVVPFVGLLGSRSLHDFADLRDRWPGCPIENQLTFARRLDEVLADVTEELVDKTNHLDFAMCNLDGLTPLARWLKVRKPLRHEPEEDPAGNFFRP